MSTVQVAVSFAIEVWKFHNIDLFHQGAFQIRCHFKTNGVSPVIIEAPTVWDRAHHGSGSFPECTAGNYVSEPEKPTSPNPAMLGSGSGANSGSKTPATTTVTAVPAKAVSKTVMIIYKDESLKMFDVIEQTMHFQIDPLNIDETIYGADITLVVELWFGEKKHEVLEEMKCVCERHLKIHFTPSQGLHHHITVMFDYYYLAAVEMVVHASLVSISPCYLRLPQTSSTDSVTILDKNYLLFQSWHSILFTGGKSNGRRHTACHVHSKLCTLLLNIIDNLLATFQQALKYFRPNQKSKIEEKLRAQLFPMLTKSDDWLTFAPNELERMAAILQAQTCEEDIADQASIDITKLSSRILVLFTEFLRTTAFSAAYIESLSEKTHRLRIKRFSEAFFFQESSIVHLLAVYDPNGDGGHEQWVGRIRDSAYYRRLPPLPIECPVTDGESHDQPVIFEQIYRPAGTASSLTGDRRANKAPRPATVAVDQPLTNDAAVDKQEFGDNVAERKGSLYQKKARRAARMVTEANSIPVMRKLNSAYKSRDSPLAETLESANVNLIGYRSLMCGAFDGGATSSLSTPTAEEGSGASPRLMENLEGSDALKVGLGSLRQIGNEQPHNSVESSKQLSRSMPDLFHADYQNVQLRSKKSRTKHRRSQSWLGVMRRSSKPLSQSSCNLVPATGQPDPSSSTTRYSLVGASVAMAAATVARDDDERLTIFEMLSRSQSDRPASTQAPSRVCSVVSDPPLSAPGLGGGITSTAWSGSGGSLQQAGFRFSELKMALLAQLRPHMPAVALYSQLPELPGSHRPYFSHRDSDSGCGGSSSENSASSASGLHYIICVHGLDGEHRDLRLVRAYLTLALPEHRLDFLMSECNEGILTFGNIEDMRERLVSEILEKMSELREAPTKISFIGHSLGCLLIRAAVASPGLAHIRSRLHTFLSLGGPHLGTLYGSSVLVNMGLWLMQKLRKSICLHQLALKDPGSTQSHQPSPQSQSQQDPRNTLLYRLAGEPSLQFFRYVLLASSPQDRYVPYHSTRIELCRASVRDSSEMGSVYMEMVTKLLQRVLQSGRTTVVRYDAHYTLPRSANNYIGRAAHIALIDSELFLEKFISVSASNYFR